VAIRLRLGLALAFATLISSPRPAQSIPFVWAFEAESTLLPGSRITGRVTIESDTADNDPRPTFGQYFDAVIGFEADVDGQPLFHSLEFGGGLVVVNIGPELPDLGVPNFYWVVADVTDVNGNRTSVSIELADSSRVVIADDLLRVVPPALSEIDPFDPTQLPDPGVTTTSLVGAYGFGNGILTRLVLVPEPSAAALLALAIAGAIALRRRLGVALAAALASAVIATPARAVPITWRIEAVVEQVEVTLPDPGDPPLPPAFAELAPVHIGDAGPPSARGQASGANRTGRPSRGLEIGACCTGIR
jgi:hypothetical protein